MFRLELASRPSPDDPPLKLVSFLTHVEKGRLLAWRSAKSTMSATRVRRWRAPSGECGRQAGHDGLMGTAGGETACRQPERTESEARPAYLAGARLQSSPSANAQRPGFGKNSPLLRRQAFPGSVAGGAGRTSWIEGLAKKGERGTNETRWIGCEGGRDALPVERLSDEGSSERTAARIRPHGLGCAKGHEGLPTPFSLNGSQRIGIRGRRSGT